MNERFANDIDALSYEMFANTYEAIKAKKSCKYQFVLQGVCDVKEVLFKICSVVWNTEIIPQSWTKTTLVQLYKGKGSRSDLDNMRHIHIKEEQAGAELGQAQLQLC